MFVKEEEIVGRLWKGLSENWVKTPPTREGDITYWKKQCALFQAIITFEDSLPIGPVRFSFTIDSFSTVFNYNLDDLDFDEADTDVSVRLKATTLPEALREGDELLKRIIAGFLEETERPHEVRFTTAFSHAVDGKKPELYGLGMDGILYVFIEGAWRRTSMTRGD